MVSCCADMECNLLNKEHSSRFNNFYNTYYGTHRTFDQWKWEFLTPSRDFGPPFPFAAVVDGEKIVGTQALIPLRMIDRKGIFWTAKSEETLIDPSYRGQNLLARMYETLFDYARENNFLGVWGFTPARKAFDKLGFTLPAQTRQLFMPFYSRYIPVVLEKPKLWPLGLIALASSRMVGFLGAFPWLLSNKTFRNKKIEVCISIQPPADAGNLCERFVKTWGGVTLYRDAKYLSWRFYQNPYLRPICLEVFQKGILTAFLAFSMTPDRMGYLVDITAAPAEEGFSLKEACHDVRPLVSAMLREAVRRLRNMGALGVRTWSVNNHPFDTLVRHELIRQGFWFVPRGFDIIFQIVPGTPERQGFNIVDHWYITRAFTQGTTG